MQADEDDAISDLMCAIYTFVMLNTIFLTGEWHMMYCSKVVSGCLICVHMCSGGVALDGDLQGGWDVQAKISIFQDLLLHL